MSRINGSRAHQQTQLFKNQMKGQIFKNKLSNSSLLETFNLISQANIEMPKVNADLKNVE